MFDKHIEQDVAVSNLLTQPHQMYSETVQMQNNIKHENVWYDRDDKTQSSEVGKQITKLTNVSGSPFKFPKTQQSSINKRLSEPTSSPNLILNDNKSTSKVIKQIIVKEEPWIPVEQKQQPNKSQ